MVSRKKSTILAEKVDKSQEHVSDSSAYLTAILAEYNALRSEIQYRSEFQNRLLEIHVSALVVLLGIGISQTLSPWIAMLIPIESSIFGLWYLDHALVIGEMGAYIRKYVETRISELFDQPSVMRWEAGYRVGVVMKPKRRVITFRRLLFITFGGPSLVVLAVYLFDLIVSTPKLSPVIQSATGLHALFVYASPQWWLEIIIWFAGLLLFSAFLSSAIYRSKISDARTAEANKATDL